MQTKIKQFTQEFNKEHDSNILVLCSDYPYKVKNPPNFKIMKQPLPQEFVFQN
jgi:hypothetical protein